MSGVSFRAGIRIVAGSFFYSINAIFSGCNAIVFSYHHHNNTKTDITVQFIFLAYTSGYVYGMIRSRPCMSGSSLPDPGRTSHLLPYLVNPPPCCTQTFILYACSVALFYFLETHQRDGIKSQKHHRALEGGVQYLYPISKLKCSCIKFSLFLYQNLKHPGSNIKISIHGSKLQMA